MKEPRELSPEELSLDVDIEKFMTEKFSDNKWGIIGQPRAVQAMEMGMAIKGRGYNLFITGDSGTGRYTAVRSLLRQHAKKRGSLQDIAYVYNFKHPENPRVLYFPEGQASEFKEQLHDLVERLKAVIREALEAEIYKRQRDELIGETEKEENHTLAEFEILLSKEGFQTMQLEDDDEQTITDIVPVFDGKPVPFDELQSLVATGSLSEEDWHDIRERYFHLTDKMNKLFSDLRNAREEMDEKLQELRHSSVHTPIEEEIAKLKLVWKDKKTVRHLEDLEKDVLKNLFLFTGTGDKEDSQPPPLSRYGVNIIVDNTGNKKIPVIKESNPTRPNLFGAIESRFDVTGEVHTNFMMIKAGSLLKANGGYLILHAGDVLTDDQIWMELRRALETETVELQIQPSPLGVPPTVLKPEPVKFQVKVVMIGPANLYEILCHQDESFQKLFKISAEFSPFMDKNDTTLKEFTAFIRSFAKKERLKEVTSDGITEICRYGIKLAERRDQLTTRFSLIADLMRESNYWADEAKKKTVDAECVKKALEMKRYISNLPEEIQNDSIEKNFISIQTEGKRIGCINGLAVLERGFYAFGSPMRISAVVGAGKDGILNIDKEVGLSGEIHSKGALILEGFLRQAFSRHIPLSVRASVCIEQSYSEIEGDSASSAELFALLSAIGKIPLRQDLAVTGSINQFGEIQPVGGVTEKIESFFSICKRRGLTGTQGALIPERNIATFLPSDEILEAMRNKQFHIYSMKSVNDGLEILTGMTAGEMGSDGRYPSGTANNAIYKELQTLSRIKD